jgi:GTP-binding protein EngB required for normal cell division
VLFRSDESDAPTLVRIGVASPFLANGFVVADTPGLASINPAHRRATLNYLPGADAVLYLIDTQQPFTDGDASFLGIIRRYLESIFIVQTKIDLWRMREGRDPADEGREAWQHASARIVAQAALHAPGTPVFPLSARDYAEALLTGDDELLAQSRFPEFLAALDASLVATTGRSRLRRAAADARRVVDRAASAVARECAALESDEASLRARRDALIPVLGAFERAVRCGADELVALGATLREGIVVRGEAMRAHLERSLARAFDIADIARLRDRAKLHIIIDDTLASEIGRFASDVAELVAERLREAGRNATDDAIARAREADTDAHLAGILDALAAERLPLTEDAAHAFGADPGSGAWSTGLETGLRSTIVLGALGGPAVGLVEAIARRFAAVPHGTYMKRELLADLDAGLFADFGADLARDVAKDAEHVAAIAQALARRLAALAPRVRDDALTAIDRALDAYASAIDRAAAVENARAQAARIGALATRIETISETFARQARGERTAHADPMIPLDPKAGIERVATTMNARFDPLTYEHGLNPQRWRVAVVGAFKRGKSSLINAIAGARVLDDEGSDVEMRFPVHVRYGDTH